MSAHEPPHGGPPHVLIEQLDLHPTAFVAPGATVVGRVKMGARSSVWFSAVMRGDMDRIELGEESNLQDGSVIHVDEGFPTIVGSRVTIGHRALVHAATVEDDCLIGMGSIVLTGARVGRGSLVAAGALVREGEVIPPGSLVVGAPARVLGPVKPEHTAIITRGVGHYVALAAAYRARGYAAGWGFGGRGLVQSPLPREGELEWADALERLEIAPARLAQDVEGLDDATLRRRPAEGKWSIAEILGHLADVEAEVFGARLGRLIDAAPDAVPEFDEPQGVEERNVAWARDRAWNDGSVPRMLAAFASARGANLARLELLGPDAWRRTGVHPERGPVTLLEQVRRFAAHDLSHLRQIERLRRELGA
jgi:carbonic anhydrase/acetyltransferase-like protein (isoleucine patch superfamily)